MFDVTRIFKKSKSLACPACGGHGRRLSGHGLAQALRHLKERGVSQFKVAHRALLDSTSVARAKTQRTVSWPIAAATLGLLDETVGSTQAAKLVVTWENRARELEEAQRLAPPKITVTSRSAKP